MRQVPALGREDGVLQSPNLVLPETPLQHQYQPVFVVQTVGGPAQTSLAADMKPGNDSWFTVSRMTTNPCTGNNATASKLGRMTLPARGPARAEWA